MKKNICVSILILAVTAFSVNAEKLNSVNDADTPVTSIQKTDNSPVHIIEIEGKHKVEYFQNGMGSEIDILVPRGMEDYADVTFSGHKLIVKWKEGFDGGDSYITARVSSPVLTTVNIKDEAQLTLKGKVKANHIKANLQDSGSLVVDDLRCEIFESNLLGNASLSVANIKSEIVRADIVGNGNAYLKGKTETARFKIEGEGNIAYGNLKMESLSYNKR